MPVGGFAYVSLSIFSNSCSALVVPLAWHPGTRRPSPSLHRPPLRRRALPEHTRDGGRESSLHFASPSISQPFDNPPRPPPDAPWRATRRTDPRMWRPRHTADRSEDVATTSTCPPPRFPVPSDALSARAFSRPSAPQNSSRPRPPGRSPALRCGLAPARDCTRCERRRHRR